MEHIAKIFENGIATDRFYIAEQSNEIIGVIACADCTQRALAATKKDCKKYLGFIRGAIVFKIIRSELMRPHSYPLTTGYYRCAWCFAAGKRKRCCKRVDESNS